MPEACLARLHGSMEPGSGALALECSINSIESDVGSDHSLEPVNPGPRVNWFQAMVEHAEYDCPEPDAWPPGWPAGYKVRTVYNSPDPDCYRLSRPTARPRPAGRAFWPGMAWRAWVVTSRRAATVIDCRSDCYRAILPYTALKNVLIYINIESILCMN